MDATCKVITIAISALAAILFSGCQLRLGVDWNGKTGIDNRTQTQLVGSEHYDEDSEQSSKRRK